MDDRVDPGPPSRAAFEHIISGHVPYPDPRDSRERSASADIIA
jgi:hypothetical protein